MCQWKSAGQGLSCACAARRKSSRSSPITSRAASTSLRRAARQRTRSWWLSTSDEARRSPTERDYTHTPHRVVCVVLDQSTVTQPPAEEECGWRPGRPPCASFVISRHETWPFPFAARVIGFRLSLLRVATRVGRAVVGWRGRDACGVWRVFDCPLSCSVRFARALCAWCRVWVFPFHIAHICISFNSLSGILNPARGHARRAPGRRPSTRVASPSVVNAGPVASGTWYLHHYIAWPTPRPPPGVHIHADGPKSVHSLNSMSARATRQASTPGATVMLVGLHTARPSAPSGLRTWYDVFSTMARLLTKSIVGCSAKLTPSAPSGKRQKLGPCALPAFA